MRVVLWASLLTIATLGPMVELVALVQRQMPSEDPRRGTLDQRLQMLLDTRDMLPEVGMFRRL